MSNNAIMGWLLAGQLEFRPPEDIADLDFNIPSKWGGVVEHADCIAAVACKGEEDQLELLTGTPYVYTDPKTGEKSYGWGFAGFNRLIEHAWLPCNPQWDDELVIMWAEIPSR
jgi:hypothetical protein